MMVLAEAIMKSLRIRATLHAVTDRRLFSVGPGSGGGGTRSLQFNGEELRKIRIAWNRDGAGNLIFRYQFPLRGKPVPEGWLSLSEVEEMYRESNALFRVLFHREPGGSGQKNAPQWNPNRLFSVRSQPLDCFPNQTFSAGSVGGRQTVLLPRLLSVSGAAIIPLLS